MRSFRSQNGFTYLLLIFAVALLGAALAGIGMLWSAEIRHEKILQAQWAGAQYRDAIGSYYQSSPGSVSVYPTTFEQLLEDKRYLTIRRHLRQEYLDPLTDSRDWIVVRGLDGGIIGVELPENQYGFSARYIYTPPSTIQMPTRASQGQPVSLLQ